MYILLYIYIQVWVSNREAFCNFLHVVQLGTFFHGCTPKQRAPRGKPRKTSAAAERVELQYRNCSTSSETRTSSCFFDVALLPFCIQIVHFQIGKAAWYTSDTSYAPLKPQTSELFNEWPFQTALFNGSEKQPRLYLVQKWHVDFLMDIPCMASTASTKDQVRKLNSNRATRRHVRGHTNSSLSLPTLTSQFSVEKCYLLSVVAGNHQESSSNHLRPTW